MSQETRRKILKGLAVTLPAAWTAPVVESIVLPAHAQTSPVCDAPEGCYAVPFFGGSLTWPGGAGPEVVDGFGNLTCSGESTGSTDVVVAESLAAAQEALLCDVSDVIELVTDPPLDNGCSFYMCDSPAVIVD